MEVFPTKLNSVLLIKPPTIFEDFRGHYVETYNKSIYYSSGIPIEFIDPAYTSQTCNACGHCERANRKSQSEFVCKACGYKAHADVNAARNIRAQALSKRALELGNHADNQVA